MLNEKWKGGVIFYRIVNNIRQAVAGNNMKERVGVKLGKILGQKGRIRV